MKQSFDDRFPASDYPEFPYEYEVFFWRKSQAESFAQAAEDKAVYKGETLCGYTAYADAMTCVREAARCIDASAIEDDLQVHLIADGVDCGDFPISHSY